MKESDFLNFSARYHRNGVAGAGFHACDFALREGRSWRPMTAIVFEAAGHVAVTDLAKPAARWRGDDFEPFLRRLIAEHESPTYYE